MHSFQPRSVCAQLSSWKKTLLKLLLNTTAAISALFQIDFFFEKKEEIEELLAFYGFK